LDVRRVRLAQVVVFLFIAAVVWFILFLGWGVVVFATGGVEAIKDCSYAEVECKGLGEFTYEDTWPLVPVLLGIPSATVGWLVARRLSRGRDADV
jgi:hypothetical protein